MSEDASKKDFIDNGNFYKNESFISWTAGSPIATKINLA